MMKECGKIRPQNLNDRCTQVQTPTLFNSMSSYEEIKTSSIDVFLLLNEIVEKTNKFQLTDIDRFAISAVTSKRVLPFSYKIHLNLRVPFVSFRRLK